MYASSPILIVPITNNRDNVGILIPSLSELEKYCTDWAGYQSALVKKHAIQLRNKQRAATHVTAA